MKGTLATLAVAATTIGLAAPAHADNQTDMAYVIFLSDNGVHVPGDMVEAAGKFAREICAYADHGMTLPELDALVHVHFNNVGPQETLAIERGATILYCPAKPTQAMAIQ